MPPRTILFILALPFLFFTIGISQTGKGSVRGEVVDETTKHPLEFVNVILQKLPDSAVVTGVSTEKSGNFLFTDVPDGKYFCRFSLIGYKVKTTVSFFIDERHQNLNLDKIPLLETEVNLDEVLVTHEKELINTSIDRKVYNVDKDVMAKSGSVSDVLQNVPSVSVDIDGNVSLRGSANVLMLINGKNSPLLGANRAEALQQIPANTIERIEVITNPSAKYKPDGESGIINIVLKKNTSLGLNGNVAANAGNQGRYNANLRLNYSPANVNMFGSYSIRQESRNRISTDSRKQTDSVFAVSFYNENLSSKARPLANIFSLGFDAELDDANSIGASGDYFNNTFTRNDVSDKVLRDSVGTATELFQRKRLDYELQRDYGLNAFFEHKFSEEEHTLRLEFNFSASPEQEDNRYTNFYTLPPSSTLYDNTLIKPSDHENELSIDYVSALPDDAKLEAGYAGQFNNSNNNFYVSYFDTSQFRFVPDSTKTNHFIFDETVHALYGTYERSFGLFGVLGGLRAEQAYRTSNLVTRDSVIKNNYFNIYPTVHLKYKFSDAAELQLNYSRRVHRPGSEELNPFPEYRDPRNISAGNPRLLPEFINSVEFGCNVQSDVFSFIPSVYYRYTTNRFTTVVEQINDSTLLTTRKNLSNDRATGIELIVSANVADAFTSHLSVNTFYNQINAANLGYTSAKSAWTWTGALTFSVNVTATTMFQMNANYNSLRLTPQGEFRPSYVANMGARQDLLDGKLSLMLTAADMFRTLKRELTLTSPMLDQTTVNKRDAGVIYFGLTYRFGTQSKKTKEESLKYDNGI